LREEVPEGPDAPQGRLAFGLLLFLAIVGLLEATRRI
jgi:hypothetical protein